MKIKKGFKLREVDSLYVVIPGVQAADTFHGMITLNETGAYLWQKLQTSTTLEALTEGMISEFAVDEETAKKDIEEFLNAVREKGLLDD